MTTMQPDGQNFASGAIGLIDLASSKLSLVTDSTHFFGYASWSQSGDALVFESFGLTYWDDTPDGADSNLWTLNVDGSNLRQITNNATGDHRATQPFWSPDGAICYVDAERHKSNAHFVRCLSSELAPLPDIAIPIQGTRPRFRPLPSR